MASGSFFSRLILARADAVAGADAVAEAVAEASEGRASGRHGWETTRGRRLMLRPQDQGAAADATTAAADGSTADGPSAAAATLKRAARSGG